MPTDSNVTYELDLNVVTAGDTSNPTVIEAELFQVRRGHERLPVENSSGLRFHLCNDGTYTNSTNGTIAVGTGYGSLRTAHTATKDITLDCPTAGAKATGVLTLTGGSSDVTDGESFVVGPQTYYISTGLTSVPAGQVAVDVSGDGTKSQGTLTLNEVPTATDTMRIGDKTYTFKATASVDGDIEIAAGVAQVETVTTVADVSDSLDATYFQLSDEAGTVGVWIDTDDSGTTIPAGASALDRAIEVTGVVTNDTDAAVATAVASAIDGDSKFSASAVGAVITVTHATAGYVADGADGDAGFSFAVTTEGTAGDTGANIVAAVNGTDGINAANTKASMAAFSDEGAAVVTALYTGAQGDSIVTTETFTDADNVFDAATLGTTTAGVNPTATEAGDAIVTAVANDGDAVVTAVNASGVVTFTAKNNGAAYNDFATTEATASGSFGAATLTGGIEDNVNVLRIEVTDGTAETVTLRVGPAVTGSYPVDFSQTVQVTHA